MDTWNTRRFALYGAILGAAYIIIRHAMAGPVGDLPTLLLETGGGALMGALLLAAVAAARNLAGRPRRSP